MTFPKVKKWFSFDNLFILLTMKKLFGIFFILFVSVYGWLYGQKRSVAPVKVKLDLAFPFAFKLPVFITPVLSVEKKGFAENEQYMVLEKEGTIEYVYSTKTADNKKTWKKNLFLNIKNRVCSSGNEEGLLGFAFDPEFYKTKRMYIYYSVCDPRKTRVSRLTLKENFKSWENNTFVLNKNIQEEILLEIDQPYSNHNGGHIEFGPDGYLYIATGDGGSAGDPKNNGQNIRSLLGKILRIDVSEKKGYKSPDDNPFVKNGAPEIFAYGLRNPWRFSFDPNTKKLWAGDVGQNKYEEVSIIEKGKNYGWRIMEGYHCYKPSKNCKSAGLVNPVYEYNHDFGASITGGYVYHGSISGLKDLYIFGDYVEGKIWMIPQTGAEPNKAPALLSTDLNISSFGLDKNGELFVLDYFSGKVFKIISE